MSFVHLHVHSCYSLLDGAIKIDDLVNTAKKMDMPAVALTDHGQMFGVWPFYKTAVKAGVKPILGVEAYVSNKGRLKRQPDESRNHLILLAENLEGYRNICRLVSRANIEGFYHRPRMDKELLAEYSDGIIALSACLKGEIPHLIMKGLHGEAEKAAIEYAEIFKDRFYLELQDNGLEEQVEVNDVLIDMSKKLSLPLVATNDCHYLLKDHHDVHDVLLCIQTGKTVDEERRMRFSKREFYFKSPEEMINAFKHLPEAISNSLDIASKCNVSFDKASYAFPKVKLQDDEKPEDKMARLAREGLLKRFRIKAEVKPFTDEEKKLYQDKLEEEIQLINQMGFPGYFIIVADFIGWAKKNNIPVGPGRGSAAGSLVAYALEITDIDPLRYGLLFERFLNPERISMPDIDVDFCTDGRDEVIKYVTETYGGKAQVSQIITFGQMKARAVIRDVGRALGIAYGEVDKIAKLVPNRLNITLDEAINEEPALKMAANNDANIKKLLNYARLLENLPRHASTHAAGVVIGDKPLMEHLPLYCDPRTPELSGERVQAITQFDMKGVEEIGLIKFDFLGLKTLTLIDQCIKIIAAGGVNINLEHLDFQDKKTYELLGRADTTGVFQLESAGMREILVKLKPNRIDDLMALVALYRPGPLKSGMVDTFIDRKHGRIKSAYPLPQLEPILKETYGVILYQEQVMKISQVLANYSLGEADILRRAMGKKQSEEMAKQKARFMAGAKENNIDLKKADQIFELMANFAEYGFNKSHSAAYAVVSYQTAYLKANYPVEFMAALFSSEKDNQDKIVRLILESRQAGITVLPPDVNLSGNKFTVNNDEIRFGLAAVKGIGQAAIESIIEARNNGPFLNLFDFCERVDTQKVNRRVLESLIKCGAFDLANGGADRATMFAALDDAIENGVRTQKNRKSGQFSMFDLMDEGASDSFIINWPKVAPWRENVRLKYEKESLGFFLTGHPLAKYETELNFLTNCSSSTIKNKADKAEVRVGGVIEKISKKVDKKGKTFAYLTLEDIEGAIEILIWSDMYEKSVDFLKTENVIWVKGLVDNGERSGQSTVKIVAKEIMLLSDALKNKVNKLFFQIPKNNLNDQTLNFLEKTIASYQGNAQAYIEMIEPGGAAIYKLKSNLCPSKELFESTKEFLGANGLKIE